MTYSAPGSTSTDTSAPLKDGQYTLPCTASKEGGIACYASVVHIADFTCLDTPTASNNNLHSDSPTPTAR